MKISKDMFSETVKQHVSSNGKNKFRISIDDKGKQLKEIFNEDILEEQEINNHDNRDILIRSKLIKADLSFQNNDGFAQYCKSHPNFNQWIAEQLDPDKLLNDILQLNYAFYLIPDTNFILDYAYSNYLDNVNLNLSHISIPRTAIWEIENLANNVPKDKLHEKRKFFLGLSEIAKIRKNGGYLNQYMDNLAQMYSNSTIRDALIRLEILNTQGGNLFNFIFLSSDVVSSFSANAEGLNTIIFHYGKYNSHLSDLEKICNLLYHSSLKYQQVAVEINGKSYNITGWWSGKSMNDYLTNQLLIKGP